MKKKYIFVDLAGGLGNQIFILEFAKYISNLNNGEIILNLTHIDSEQFGGKSTIRDFTFTNNYKSYKLNPILKRILDSSRKFSTVINRINRRLVFVMDEVKFKTKKYSIEHLIQEYNPKFIFISGFWQNFKYWQDVLEYEINDRSADYSWYLKLIQQHNPIIFHYRIGDFGQKWQYQWGILSPKFLTACLCKINKDRNEGGKQVWIFSDNIAVAKSFIQKEFLPSNFEINYIMDSQMKPAEVLLLLSKSSTLICSNSTYSLAAAKIGNVESVFIPDTLSKFDAVDFATPKEWVKMKSIWMS